MNINEFSKAIRTSDDRSAALWEIMHCKHAHFDWLQDVQENLSSEEYSLFCGSLDDELMSVFNKAYEMGFKSGMKFLMSTMVSK